MFQKTKTINEDIVSIQVKGKITAGDYSRTLIPILKQAHSVGRKVRFLFHLGPEYKGFTLGAGWEDFKLGFKYIRTFERCAIVTDVRWIRTVSSFFGLLFPCPVHVFKNREIDEAKKWLYSRETGLEHHLDRENGVLEIDISGPLTSASFDTLTREADEWIASKGALSGLVIHVKKFPGWEDLGSLLSHVTFIKNHHHKIKKVALCSDGKLPYMVSGLAEVFVEAEVKIFKYRKLPEALSWAA